MSVEPSAGPGANDSALADAVHVLGLEALALKVIAVMQDRAIEVLLLKGPVTNRWLYGDPIARRFSDIDILIDPRSRERAETVLQNLGFRNEHAHVLGIYRPDYETSWTSAGGTVDLHTRIAGIPADRAASAWCRLAQDSTEFSLHGRTVATLSLAGRTMQLGLHAARGTNARALKDLEVGLAALPRSLWLEASDLVSELGAGACFEVGLRRCEPGRNLAAELGLDAAPTIESLLLDHGASQEAFVVAAAVEHGARPSPRALAAWFTTEAGERPPCRRTLAALLGLPRALTLVLRMKWRTRRPRPGTRA